MSNYYTETPTTETHLFNQEHRIPVYGGFWERFAAAIIDGIVMGVINKVIQLAIGEIEGAVAGILVNCLYFALMESSERGATLGKMALGLRVTDMNGGRITFMQGLGRYFGKILSSIILFIGYLMMVWDDRKQTLHDKMAGTLVVKADRFQDQL
ncbi:RDD family protein [Flaviaesturariibacter flavus]|uniref:RDD family protein n=1 Tax=Flaviaesturariibacter flavus TaxID=2502780 RepID=A0A4R1BBW9_9BACT|nr:RDD family protein [Flaviaesturariibacter flavus]TCJ14509.1 RDD family protein [Flaviaesturariibacter flavus]